MKIINKQVQAIGYPGSALDTFKIQLLYKSTAISVAVLTQHDKVLFIIDFILLYFSFDYGKYAHLENPD